MLYTPSIDHIHHYNMSYSEGDDSDSNCESFSVGDDETSDAESSDSSTDGDTKSDGDGRTAGASLSDSPWSCVQSYRRSKVCFV